MTQPPPLNWPDCVAFMHSLVIISLITNWFSCYYLFPWTGRKVQWSKEFFCDCAHYWTPVPRKGLSHTRHLLWLLCGLSPKGSCVGGIYVWVCYETVDPLRGGV
jgi:hypothetical protein